MSYTPAPAKDAIVSTADGRSIGWAKVDLDRKALSPTNGFGAPEPYASAILQIEGYTEDVKIKNLHQGSNGYTWHFELA